MAKRKIIPDDDPKFPIEDTDLVAPRIEESPVEASASRITVLFDYGGRRTHDERITPGVYFTDDLLKYGADFPAYLVSTGNAVWGEVK